MNLTDTSDHKWACALLDAHIPSTIISHGPPIEEITLNKTVVFSTDPEGVDGFKLEIRAIRFGGKIAIITGTLPGNIELGWAIDIAYNTLSQTGMIITIEQQ